MNRLNSSEKACYYENELIKFEWIEWFNLVMKI